MCTVFSFVFFCLNVYLCTVCVPGAHAGQKKVSDPLRLDLQMAVSY